MKSICCSINKELQEAQSKCPLNKNIKYQKELLSNIMKKNKEEYEKYYDTIQTLEAFSPLYYKYKNDKFNTLSNILLENNKWVNSNIELFYIEILKIQEELKEIYYGYYENKTIYKDNIFTNMEELEFINLVRDIVISINTVVTNEISDIFYEKGKREKFKFPEYIFTTDSNINKFLNNLEKLFIDIVNNIHCIVKHSEDNFNELLKYLKDKLEIEEVFNEYYEILYNMRETYYNTMISIIRSRTLYLFDILIVSEVSKS